VATAAGGEAWTYVVAINTSTAAVELSDRLGLAEAGIADAAPRSVYDWRARTLFEADTELTATLAPRDWRLFVVASPGRRADEGDLDRYVTVPSTLG
jgi:hypothetical protein